MLRVIRQNAGYQQMHVAKLLGHKNSVAVSDWENEKRLPSATNLIKLCILYEKTPQELYPEYCQRIERYFITI
jgi:transcriptional regulator with XRE-family HTH domain